MSAERKTKRPWPIRLCRWVGVLSAVYLFLGFVIRAAGGEADGSFTRQP